MQDPEILIRYKCKKCGGDGARRNDDGRVSGNCTDCGGDGKFQKWVDYRDLRYDRYLK